MHIPDDGQNTLLGQIALAVLIVLNTIVSAISSYTRRKSEQVNREAERVAARADRMEIEQNLLHAQRVAGDALAELLDLKASKVIEKVESVHEDLKANTVVNEAALTAANNFNTKIETVLSKVDSQQNAN